MALDDGSGETAWAIKITDGGSNENFEMGRVISRTFSVYGRNFVTFTILSSSARVMKAVKIGCAEIGEHAAPASRTLSQSRFGGAQGGLDPGIPAKKQPSSAGNVPKRVDGGSRSSGSSSAG
jgi:hypothetical protein